LAAAEVYLADPRVRLNHATIESGDQGVVIRALDDALLTVNGVATAVSSLQPGDKVGLGPYELVVEPPGDGTDVGVTVELVHPLAGDESLVLTRRQTDVGTFLPGKRRLSWALFVAIVILFLAVPIAATLAPSLLQASKRIGYSPLAVWNSGPISNVHRMIADDCGTCHSKPFVMVENDRCIACHAGIQQHADRESFPFADLNNTRCEGCHKEHNGPVQITRTDESFCVACHGGLRAVAAKTELLDAGSFGTSHPEFRPTVVVDAREPTFERRALNAAPPPQERSNLNFPHDKHLKAEGLRTAHGMVQLTCTSCHKPDPARMTLLPVTMELHCAGCHQLKFERSYPDWEVPHAKPEGVKQAILGLYSAVALTEKRDVGAATPTDRLRPGHPSRAERIYSEEGLIWARERAAEAMATTFGSSVCGACHGVDRPTGDDPFDWRIRPVHVAERFMPKARFDHGKHETVACTHCHDAMQASSSAAVMLPKIEICRDCHGGEKPAPERVASSCTACHGFHLHPSPVKTGSARVQMTRP
jgi:predicted CXXCH cytochrome family protein